MSRPYKKTLIAALVACQVALCLPASAQDIDDAQHEALTRQMVEMEFGRGVFQEITAQLTNTAMSGMPQAMESRLGRELSPGEQEQLAMLVRGVFMEVFPQNAWEEAMLPVYMKYLNSDDVEDVLTFYKTPVGEKMLRLQATLMREGVSARENLLQERNEEFMRRFAEELAEQFPDWEAGPRPTGAVFIH